MCCTSIHLLIGALLVFAVENEATAMNVTENATAPVSVNTNKTSQFKMDSTTPSFNSKVPNQVDVNTTSGSPTPPPQEHPQTKNYTTYNSLKNVSQSSPNNMSRNATTSKTTTVQTVKTSGPTSSTKSKAASAAPSDKGQGKTTSAAPSEKGQGSTTYAVIFIIALLVLAGVIVYCCLTKKSRKYSVELHPKHEDAQIPLSTVDAEVFDTTSVKESTDVKQENQQKLSSSQAPENPKDKMEGLTVVDLTDGEPTISTKTSMESLDDVLNENNSNNTRVEVKGNGHDFTEISIDA
ncbi:uncharacterized protein LOC127949176 isoform X5 [Carassius gibelio]|uniref:uncharacterized protein LOC127949176 isoform X5 n=1 Tax=Carassius gibelio TaxID=101364 RepID=UPI002278CE96|nr:uncharacterized protein LOC127949176 isoform X5 [Carassius gibelio]